MKKMIDKIKYWWFKYIRKKQLLTDDNGNYITDKNGEHIWED